MARTILLVEDSPTIRSIVRIYLMGLDLEFIEADRGDKALELLQQAQNVSLILADINMPGMDGLTFLKALRAHDKSSIKGLPVVLLTGERSDDVRLQCMTAGANDFVRKPVGSANLREVVQRHLA